MFGSNVIPDATFANSRRDNFNPTRVILSPHTMRILRNNAWYLRNCGWMRVAFPVNAPSEPSRLYPACHSPRFKVPGRLASYKRMGSAGLCALCIPCLHQQIQPPRYLLGCFFDRSCSYSPCFVVSPLDPDFEMGKTFGKNGEDWLEYCQVEIKNAVLLCFDDPAGNYDGMEKCSEGKTVDESSGQFPIPHFLVPPIEFISLRGTACDFVVGVHIVNMASS
jgi:hypothetical protein